jgi:hypothetical protein
MSVTLLFVVFGKFLFDSVAALRRERGHEQRIHRLEAAQAAAHASGKAQREYVLEVLGLGVTYEKYRQGRLWDALKRGDSYSSLREQDPKEYPWSGFDKVGVSGGRALDALENGAESSPMFWGVPTFHAGPPDPTLHGVDTGLAGSAEGTGMAWHLFLAEMSELEERPDRLLEKVFAYMDANPDLPYVVLTADDSSSTRDDTLPAGVQGELKDGYFVPSRPDATAAFVLARRERVEPLRPYVWDDRNSDYLQDNLRMVYYDLKDATRPPGQGGAGRNPTVAEWMKAMTEFAKHPSYYDHDQNLLTQAISHAIHHPPRDWKPTPWFPLPWNREQMKAFDSLPSLGFVHRPVFVKFQDEHGQPVVQREARQKMLEAGWNEALQTLPDAEREHGPRRIIAAYGNHTDHAVAMERLLHEYAAQGGPKIDSGELSQFINTDRRLGNTGAATFFMQMALGVMGSYIEGGPSAAINLRDPAGASIVFVSPPSEERRRRQIWDVFKHEPKPDIDPHNYQTPTVGELVAH